MTPDGSGFIPNPEVGGAARRAAFPVALALCAAAAFALLIGLGVWQLHRLAWKEALLAKVAALRVAPAQPLATVLHAAGPPGSAEFRRVSLACQPPATPSPMIFRYALRDGQVAWRLLTFCRLQGPGIYDGVLLDRGFVAAFSGRMAPSPARFAEPQSVTGILRAPGSRPWLDDASARRQNGVVVTRVIDRDVLESLARESGLAHPVPYMVSVESERPAPGGIIAAAIPGDIPNNHLGYALTWFGLAAALTWIAGALIRKRLVAP